MPEVSCSVQWFVENQLELAEGEQATVEEAWRMYSGVGGDEVPRSEFKWHLDQALPDSVERDTDTFEGIRVSDT